MPGKGVCACRGAETALVSLHHASYPGIRVKSASQTARHAAFGIAMCRCSARPGKAADDASCPALDGSPRMLTIRQHGTADLSTMRGTGKQKSQKCYAANRLDHFNSPWDKANLCPAIFLSTFNRHVNRKNRHSRRRAFQLTGKSSRPTAAIVIATAALSFCA